jgi:DNA-binding NarL/FixJ family response regulator
MATLSAPILFVENDNLVARSVERVLRRNGLRVQHIPSCRAARKAVELLKAGDVAPFELGIFDIDLGDGNGVNLAKELLASGLVRRSVFFTACNDESVHRQAHDLGSVVIKSRGVDALLESVRHGASA